MSEAAKNDGKEGLFMRLPAELVDGWRALAEARGMTLTAFQALVMRSVLEREGPVSLPDRTAGATKRSVTLRLRSDEIDQVKAAAKEEGHSMGGWLAMLIRARLRKTPIYTKEETVALLKASTQLMAVGRNINAAVRRLHAEGVWGSQLQPMKATLDAVRKMEAHINGLQEAAERRANF